MDSITHILAGTAMGYAASEKYGKATGAAIVMASVAPDLDNVLKLAGNVTYLEYHRVISNSLPGMAVLSLLCALIAGRFWKDGGLARLWGFAFASVSVHVVFDLLNSYGAKPFWPVSDTWYALDSVFIVDPFMTVPIIAAIVLMKLGRDRRAVFLGLAALIVIYAGGRVALHGLAVTHIETANPSALRVGAFPHPVNPLRWRAVVEHREGYVTGWYDLVCGSVDDVETLVRPKEGNYIEAARSAPAVRVFLDFARFPLASVETVDGGRMVSFTDLRFSFLSGDRRFVASVLVHDDMSHGPGDFRFGSD